LKRSALAQLKARPSAWQQLVKQAADLTEENVYSSAIVFAPHQDDETLGCGGAIIKKRNVGAKVACVFMTNGETSHQAFIPPQELTELRNREALAATGILGIPKDDVHFLSFPDGNLGAHHSAALSRVSSLLSQYQPQEIFVPYRFDGTPDHESTFRIVAEAVRARNRPLKVYEYPVWFWNQWPWVSLSLRPNRPSAASFFRAFRSRFGGVASKDFRSRIHIGDVLPLKRQALDQHRSQMSVLMPQTSWPTLHDVSNGEFLRCFFRDFELFRVTIASP
jgi:LmbE family N-acetylglucosaminyl deacetylase